MRKMLLVAAVFAVFVVVIPGPSLFADFGFRGRLDAGADLVLPFVFIPDSYEDSGILPVLPLFDLGFFGQLNLGIFHLGAGLRGTSFLVYLNLFWPSAYAELNLWRFTLNAQVGGGILYLFPIFFFSAPVLIPEASLWYAFDKNKRFNIGAGVLSMLSPENINKKHFQNFDNYRNNIAVYAGFKFSFVFGNRSS